MQKFMWGGKENDKKKIHLVAWSSVIHPKSKGGLGVGCLKTVNVTLLTKWLWRLKTESKSLWKSCINSFHNNSGIDGKPFAKNGLLERWLSIAKIGLELEEWSISLDNLFERKFRTGDTTYFWKDAWFVNTNLKNSFPKLYLIEAQKIAKLLIEFNMATL